MDGGISPFDQESMIFLSINESLTKDVLFEVYGPVEFSGIKDKNQKLYVYKKEIENILKKI